MILDNSSINNSGDHAVSQTLQPANQSIESSGSPAGLQSCNPLNQIDTCFNCDLENQTTRLYNILWTDGSVDQSVPLCLLCCQGVEDLFETEPAYATPIEPVAVLSTSNVRPAKVEEPSPAVNPTQSVEPSLASTSELDAMILALLEKNPDLRSKILGTSGRRLSDAPSLVPRKRRLLPRPKGSTDRIIISRHLCLLCGSMSVDRRLLCWDADKGCYSSLAAASNTPTVYPEEVRTSESISCSCCKVNLLTMEKEKIVDLLILLQNPLLSEARDGSLRKTLRHMKDSVDNSNLEVCDGTE